MSGGGGIGRSPLVRLSVAVQSGGYATNIRVKGENWGDYFIYDDVASSWITLSNKIVLGNHTDPGNTTFGIGYFAGYLQQTPTAIAIGTYAGNVDQYAGSIAHGHYAGQFRQGGIAIGNSAGNRDQSAGAIAMGLNAGFQNQSTGAIAIGLNAGSENQSAGAIAIGENAGSQNQSKGAVAIGQNTGDTGSYSISIGQKATGKGIAINATNIQLTSPASGVFVKPIRGPMIGNNLLSWDTGTKEIFYNGSSERFKYDIQPLRTATTTRDLQPREFKYKLDDVQDVGLIAEEAFKVNPSFAYLDKEQTPEGIQWNAITTSLIAELQEMKRMIAVLKANKANASI